MPSIDDVTRAGLLPPWGTAALPPPPPFTLQNVARTVGPGVIGLGVAIGSGEWLLGPSVVVRYGPALLWITTVAVLLQVFLNLEMARYTLYTGEPIVTGYMRTRPGPVFWGWVYSLASLLQYGWPGWALASATASAALWLGRMPGDPDGSFVRAIGYATLGACFLIASLGKKVERTVERAMWFMVIWVFTYLIAVDVGTASAANWQRIATGFLAVGELPRGADWVLLGAFAAYSGLGGVGNAYITNWMRDKGYGMGATVGYIPAAMGSRIKLSPQGNVFPLDERSLQRWRQWWRYVLVDQWAIFGLGSIAGMALTTLLTLEYVPAGQEFSGWAVAGYQAQGIAKTHGRLFWHLTLLCGVAVLFSTQLGVTDGLPRSITDILWSGSARVRRWRGGDVRAVYYGVLATFAVWGGVALNLAQPLTLIMIGANMAAVSLVLQSVHTLVVNRTCLPAALRPAWWREAILVLCAIFYGSFVAAALLRSLS